jgi:acyl carrier protein
MSDLSIVHQIATIIIELGCNRKPLEMIRIQDQLQQDLGLDSLGAVELIFSLEEKFNITILDEEILHQESWMNTVQSLADFIEGKVNQQTLK